MKENFYVSSDLGIDHVRVMAKQFHMKNEICLERASHVLRLEGLFATKKKKIQKICSKSRKHGKWNFNSKTIEGATFLHS